jgi:GTPase SAR1 family protein
MTSSPTVRLSAIIEAIDLSSRKYSFYLNRNAGQIITLDEEEIYAAEKEDDLDNYPGWQRDNILMARDLLENDKNYLDLPTKYDLDESRHMEKFILSFEDSKTWEILYAAIKGKGAFRRFKETVHRLNLTDHWYAYRENSVPQMAIDWCELNGIHWQDI